MAAMTKVCSRIVWFDFTRSYFSSLVWSVTNLARVEVWIGQCSQLYKADGSSYMWRPHRSIPPALLYITLDRRRTGGEGGAGGGSGCGVDQKGPERKGIEDTFRS